LSPRKLAIAVFFASVVINAGLGIFALFAGEFGDFQGKVLVTSLSVSAGSVLSLAMFPARERGLLRPVPAGGVALSILGFGLLIILVWTDFSSGQLGRLTGSVLTLAVSSGYASLITLAVVNPKYINIMRSAYALVTVLSLMIIGALWGEPEADMLPRLLGVVSILLAAATVSIPVLHRLNREMVSTPIGENEQPQPLHCVSCGSTEISTYDGITYACGACQARFCAEILV